MRLASIPKILLSARRELLGTNSSKSGSPHYRNTWTHFLYNKTFNRCLLEKKNNVWKFGQLKLDCQKILDILWGQIKIIFYVASYFGVDSPIYFNDCCELWWDTNRRETFQEKEQELFGQHSNVTTDASRSDEMMKSCELMFSEIVQHRGSVRTFYQHDPGLNHFILVPFLLGVSGKSSSITLRWTNGSKWRKSINLKLFSLDHISLAALSE